MMTERHVVVIEDDPSIADLVALYLQRDGFTVTLAIDGERGLEAVERTRPSLAVVDIGLPGGMDGLAVCRHLRATTGVPVVILTARGDEIDRILGLELGADDYVTKPFSPRELIARINAVLRRSDPAEKRSVVGAPVLTAGDVCIDTGRREVRRGSTVVALTPREFDLLQYLATNAGLALSRSQLLDGVWGPGWYGDERTVDVHVRQLRAKLGDGLPLVTIRSVGYRLD
jgi:DNA-binding response OmpR family regulator